MSHRIRKITNITSEDFMFTFEGVPFTVRAGKTMVFQEQIAELGAKHLAHKIVMDRKNSRKEPLLLEDRAHLQKSLKEDLIRNILGDFVDTLDVASESPQEKLKREHVELQEKFAERIPLTEHTKKELLEICEARGLKADNRMSKEDLVKLIEGATGAAADVAPAAAPAEHAAAAA